MRTRSIPRARGKNLDDDVRRLVDDALGLVDAKARIADHDEIWLNNVVSTEIKIDRMRVDPTTAAGTQGPLQDPIEVGGNFLVIATRRGIHYQLSLEYFPPIAIIWHLPEVVIGERA